MKKSTIIIIAVVLLASISAVVYFSSQPKSEYTETSKKEPETYGGRSIVIANISRISDILLPSQTQAVRTGLNSFLLEYLDPNITGAAIVTNPTISPDGSVTFTMEAKAPEGKRYSFERKNPNSDYAVGQTIEGSSKAATNFTVVINRESNASVTISIREYNYTSVEALATE